MAKVRVGRDLTNQLCFHFLTEDEKKIAREANANGSFYPDILEYGKQRQRVSIKGQIDIIKALKMHHLELDLSPKHPYEQLYNHHREILEEASEYALENDVSISGHLSYSYATASACAPQTSHRKAAVATFKTEVDIIKSFGATHAVMHGGTIPFWEDTPANKTFLDKALVETLYEVGSYAAEKGIILEFENNVVADSCFYNIDHCMEILEKVNARGVKVLFCFDVGHYMTRADKGLDISLLEKVLEDETIAKYSAGTMHLNGYIPQEFENGKLKPGTGRYHPLLHKEESPLKISNIEHHAQLNQKIGTKAVVIESAASGFADMIDMDNQLKYETEIILKAFGYSDYDLKDFSIDNVVNQKMVEVADKVIQPLFENGF
jgi:sugar phosphate isomerase/epimerase